MHHDIGLSSRKVLIIGNQDDKNSEKAYYKTYVQFFSGLSEKSVSVNYCTFDDLLFDLSYQEIRITDTRNNFDLKEYDVVFIRGKIKQVIDEANVVSKYLKAHDRIIINDYSAFRSSSKLSQAATFYYAGLSIPRTLFGNIEKILEIIENEIGFPVVAKDTHGSHGLNNYLIKNKQHLNEILASNSDVQLLIQQYIPNDGDFRVLIIGDDHLVIKRTAHQGSHLNNTSQGAEAQLVSADQFPEGLVNDSKKITKLLDMTIAGVDILYDSKTDQHFFLEVNSQPQLMTGAFVEEKRKALAKIIYDPEL